MRLNPWRAFRAGATCPVRPQNLIAIAGNLHATISLGAESTVAIERANPTRPGADRIERIETGEFDVEPGAGPVVEGRKRPAGRRVPFAVDLAGLASDPLQFG